MHFAVRCRFAKSTSSELAHDAAPECDCGFVVEKLADLPRAGEPIEDEQRSFSTDAQTTLARFHEKLCKSEVDRRAMLPWWATHERETHGAIVFQNDERMRTVVGEPARHQFGFALAELAGSREDSRVHAELRQVLEIFGVAFLNPATVLR